jgi:hypothetical protein
MTAGSPVERFYTAVQQRLMGAYDSDASGVAPIKGHNREIFVQKFLQRIFPPHIRFGSGMIVDHKQRVSGQCDIVAEWPFGPSLQIEDDATRYYFADLVAAVISVKSDVRSQWSQVMIEMEKLKSVDFNVNVDDTGFGKWERQVPLFIVGYKGFTDKVQAKQFFEDGSYPQKALAILTIESGVYVSGIGRNGQPAHIHDGWQGLHCFVSDLVDKTINIVMGSSLEMYLTSQPEKF